MNNANEIGRLDSLFKGAAIDYELPFNEEAWNLMEKKLDNSQKSRRFIFWWVSAIILIAGITIYSIAKYSNNGSLPTENIANNNAQNNSSSLNNSISKLDLDTKNSQISNTVEKNTNNEITNSAKNNITKVKETENNTDKNAVQNTVLAKRNYLQPNSENKRIRVDKNVLTGTNILTKPQNKNEFANNLPVSTKNTEIINVDKNNKLNENQLIANKNKSTYVDDYLKKIEYSTKENLATRYYTLENLPLHNRYITDFEKIASENEAAIFKLEEKLGLLSIVNIKNSYTIPSASRNIASSNWFVTGSIANNIGYVSSPALNNASLQYQFTVGYNINKHLSISTGLSFGNRQFDMRRDQFTYKGNPSYDKSIKSISANISLIDFPINLKYQFSNRDNDGWFTTMGVSTVYLKEENYRLLIDNGSPFYYDQNFSNTTSKLSMLNLSIGYQYALNKTFSLTLEPYVQLPFKSIGGGGMKMSSVGLQFGGKYSFIRKKK